MANLSSLISKLQAQDVRVKELQAELTKESARRTKLEAQVLKRFDKQQIQSQKTNGLLVTKAYTDYPSIKDRGKFLKYVLSHEAFELFQNRVSPTALKEHQQEGNKVPGIEVYRKWRIQLKVVKNRKI